ncbi:hypothetical protein ZWY2020_014028 [Hordeum vulgare]|nr:hypothetical protein ZWY2020_014028 [Hordeum vulgare]
MTRRRRRRRGEREEPAWSGLAGVRPRRRDVRAQECRDFLRCNQGYRLIRQTWTGRFLVKTGLLVKKERRKGHRKREGGGEGGESSSPVAARTRRKAHRSRRSKVRPARLELWAFRSPKLTMGCPSHADRKLRLDPAALLRGEGQGARRRGQAMSRHRQQPCPVRDEPEPRGSEEDAMEPAAVPNAGDEMAIDEPSNVVPADAHVDEELPVMEAGRPDEDRDVAMANVRLPARIAGATRRRRCTRGEMPTRAPCGTLDGEPNEERVRARGCRRGVLPAASENLVA